MTRTVSAHPACRSCTGSNGGTAATSSSCIDVTLARSAFLARQAAATAMAAETPHTEVAAAMMMVRVREDIFSHRVPNSHMKMMTVGVTTQATSSPGRPSCRISEKRISAPRSCSWHAPSARRH